MRNADIFDVKNSISTRLFGRIMAVALISGILVSFGQILLDFRDDKARAQELIDNLIHTSTPLASTAAYEINQNSAKDVLMALLTYRPVVSAKIIRETGELLAAVNRDSPPTEVGAFATWIYGDINSISVLLFHPLYDNSVGELLVFINPEYLVEDVSRRAWITIFLGLAKNSMLALIFLYIFQLFLTRPVVKMTTNLKSFNKNYSDPVFIETPKGHSEDELGLLARSMNEYIAEAHNNHIKMCQLQKMEATGQLTGGIAHDFNNILGIIMGNLELIERRTLGDEKISAFVADALKATSRGANITKKLLTYTRQETGIVKLVSLNKFVAEMESLITKSLTVSIRTITHLGENIWPVKINPGDFQDALLNLSLNARHAMPDGGDLIVETSNKVLDEIYTQRNPQAKAGEFVMISVSDNGQGMTPDTQERALEPFFTTKEEGKGTGLGLSMVYGFVKRSGGHLKIYSEIGKGTTIRIYFPRAVEGSRAEEEESVLPDTPRGTETILIVDDEEALVKIAALKLEDLGYQTVTAANGQRALQTLKDNNNIDLLFTDVVMPGGMDGYQLALAAHELNPMLKVLLTTGFSRKHQVHANGEDAYLSSLASSPLSKPYNQSELALAVRNALDTEQ